MLYSTLRVTDVREVGRGHRDRVRIVRDRGHVGPVLTGGQDLGRGRINLGEDRRPGRPGAVRHRRGAAGRGRGHGTASVPITGRSRRLASPGGTVETMKAKVVRRLEVRERRSRRDQAGMSRPRGRTRRVVDQAVHVASHRHLVRRKGTAKEILTLVVNEPIAIAIVIGIEGTVAERAGINVAIGEVVIQAKRVGGIEKANASLHRPSAATKESRRRNRQRRHAASTTRSRSFQRATQVITNSNRKKNKNSLLPRTIGRTGTSRPNRLARQTPLEWIWMLTVNKIQICILSNYARNLVFRFGYTGYS